MALLLFAAIHNPRIPAPKAKTRAECGSGKGGERPFSEGPGPPEWGLAK
ncbi:hypothetical protein GCWU000341_02089 [Oribacterium sp. oral taxon 078 str. F0262]|nr:hypothetical protein GCWU000341_02089 [Oribacterium sp. oral taxon 078 str. F0262]